MSGTRLVLVRHGESNVTVDRVIGGLRACTGLSALGVRQAEALGTRWAGGGEVDPVDVLLSSNMPRARQTADIVAPAVGGLVPEEVDDLREQDPGEADGMRFDDYVAAYGAPDFEAQPDRPLAPGGESLNTFHDRVLTTMAGVVRALEGRTLVVVCHGGVINAALRGLLGLPMVGGFELFTSNTSITELVALPEGRWRLVRYNDAAHLAALPGRTEPQVAARAEPAQADGPRP